LHGDMSKETCRYEENNKRGILPAARGGKAKRGEAGAWLDLKWGALASRKRQKRRTGSHPARGGNLGER